MNESISAIEYVITQYEEYGGFHNEPVKAKKARSQLKGLLKRIAEMEHEIAHLMGDCDCQEGEKPVVEKFLKGNTLEAMCQVCRMPISQHVFECDIPEGR